VSGEIVPALTDTIVGSHGGIEVHAGAVRVFDAPHSEDTRTHQARTADLGDANVEVCGNYDRNRAIRAE